MGTRGPVKRSARPALRIVGLGENDAEAIEAAKANDTATRLLAPKKPEQPAGMSEQGAALWDQLADQLDGAGLLAATDGLALDLAVRAYMLAVDASDEVLREGITSTGSMGQPVAHPAAQAFRSATGTYMEMAKQLGLTFAARARINVPEGVGDVLDTGNPFGGTGQAAGQ